MLRQIRQVANAVDEHNGAALVRTSTDAPAGAAVLTPIVGWFPLLSSFVSEVACQLMLGVESRLGPGSGVEQEILHV